MFAMKLAKHSTIFVARMWYLFMFLGMAVYSYATWTPTVTTTSALTECMNKYRWDTTAVRTSRFSVEMAYNRQGKGELAKYVSDYDAVKMVYCSGK